MGKHYLLFASHNYAFSILRPLEEEIKRRNDIAAWYLEETCDDILNEDEKRLRTFEEVKQYNPIAVFAPGNWIYDFFPGVKVEVFHGYPIRKRAGKKEDSYVIRGWFDIYCTQGKTSTLPFKELEKKYGYFKVYETGWCRVDSLLEKASIQEESKTPTILYACTFTKGISSAWIMPPVIDKIAQEKPWNWIITIHPKLKDPDIIEKFQELTQKHKNVRFEPILKDADAFKKSDVLLCDSSSIIIEYMLLDKPVVTYRNTHPGNYLIDVQNTDDIEPAIEKALIRPKELMDNIRDFTMQHENHRDGKNCARILDAVDDFIEHYQNRIKHKPLNLIRKLKLRWRLKYFKIK
jgi:CDP-glycerol glycerophosphotransferase (TagB/SpsB family)